MDNECHIFQSWSQLLKLLYNYLVSQKVISANMINSKWKDFKEHLSFLQVQSSKNWLFLRKEGYCLQLFWDSLAAVSPRTSCVQPRDSSPAYALSSGNFPFKICWKGYINTVVCWDICHWSGFCCLALYEISRGKWTLFNTHWDITNKLWKLG